MKSCMKKAVLIALLLLLGAFPSEAAITPDTHGGADNGSVSASTLSVTLAVTAGDLIVVSATWNNAGTPTATCADNVNAGNYPVAIASVNDTNIGQITQSWYFANSGGGSVTITVTLSAAATFLAMTASSWKGAITNSTVLGPADNTANGSGSGTYTSANITPANDNALIYSSLTYSTAIVGAGTSFTLLDNDTSTGFADEDRILVGGGGSATNATWNAGATSNFWRACIVAFYPAVAGGAAPMGINKRQKLEQLDDQTALLIRDRSQDNAARAQPKIHG